MKWTQPNVDGLWKSKDALIRLTDPHYERGVGMGKREDTFDATVEIIKGNVRDGSEIRYTSVMPKRDHWLSVRMYAGGPVLGRIIR